ncbi:MAG TPA: hypothetical protein VF371_08785 [Candidatus Limnocylindrales bacterium]
MLVNERRTTVYILGIAFLALLLFLAAYMGRSFVGRTVNESAWTEKNESALASLPIYPGATQAGAPFSEGEPYPNADPKTAESGPFKSYWTTHSYKLSPEARSDLVLGFYSRELAGWRAWAEQGANCEILYRRGRTLLELKACAGSLTLSFNYEEFDG